VITRRSLLHGGAALTATSPRAPRRIALLVGAVAGSGADSLASAFAPFLARQLPYTEIALRNVPGNGGLNALNALADAPASGATFGWTVSPTLPARIVDRGGEGLMQHITLLGSIELEPIVFVSPAATPIDSVQDLIRRAADDADAVPFGTPPPGSPPHLAALRLQTLAQTRLNIVPFPSAAAARQAVIGGNVSAAALGLSDAIEALRDDKLVGLGIAARKRAGILPDLPVLNEAGVPLSASIRRGLAAPVGLPPELAQEIVGALHAVTLDGEFREHANSAGLLVSWADGAAWTAQVEAERVELARLWMTDPWLNAKGG
jgi:tripartite-type tricarboxylate transporter receptor subunit TctC